MISWKCKRTQFFHMVLDSRRSRILKALNHSSLSRKESRAVVAVMPQSPQNYKSSQTTMVLKEFFDMQNNWIRDSLTTRPGKGHFNLPSLHKFFFLNVYLNCNQPISSPEPDTSAWPPDPFAGSRRASVSVASGHEGGSNSDWRHVGQEECEANQMSMHLTWKPWWHLGRTLIFSPSSNSPRHIGQSVAGKTTPVPYSATGICRSMLFFSPVAARRAAVSSGDSKVNLRLHLKAHLTIEFSPRAHINAQSRAARMMTILVSNFVSLVYPLCVLLSLLGGESSWAPRRKRCGRW